MSMTNTLTTRTRANHQFDGGGFDENSESSNLSEACSLAGVEIDTAPNATVCGALGCQKTEDLHRGIIDDVGQRVLCTEHLEQILIREVLNS